MNEKGSVKKSRREKATKVDIENDTTQNQQQSMKSKANISTIENTRFIRLKDFL